MVEWELLQKEHDLELTNRRVAWVHGSRTAVLSRDDDYSVILKVEGQFPKRKAPSFVDPDDARAWTPGIGDFRAWDTKKKRRISGRFLRYDLSGVWFPSSNLQSRGDSRHVSFRLSFAIQEVVTGSRSPSQSPIVWRSDWYLNGPVDMWLFKRSTYRQMKIRSRTRQRESVPGPITKLLTFDPIDVRHDVLLHNKKRLKFLVNLVHPDFGPKWGHPLALEYHQRWGIPDDETRKRVAEIVGFILGRQLLPVGWTEYADGGLPIRHGLRTPLGKFTRLACAGHEHLPTPLGQRFMGTREIPEDAEVALNDLVTPYLANCEELRLSAAVARYNASYLCTLETAITTVVSAIEGLSKAWTESANRSVGGMYMDKAEFKRLSKRGFRYLDHKFAQVPEREPILTTIRGANQISVRFRLTRFFAELGLPIGAAEEAALKERNYPAHGGAYATPAQVESLQVSVAVARTLFHRILLKLLGYSGDYVDLSDNSIRHLLSPSGLP